MPPGALPPPALRVEAQPPRAFTVRPAAPCLMRDAALEVAAAVCGAAVGSRGRASVCATRDTTDPLAPATRARGAAPRGAPRGRQADPQAPG